jgi:hypothetical protein
MEATQKGPYSKENVVEEMWTAYRCHLRQTTSVMDALNCMADRFQANIIVFDTTALEDDDHHHSLPSSRTTTTTSGSRQHRRLLKRTILYEIAKPKYGSTIVLAKNPLNDRYMAAQVDLENKGKFFPVIGSNQL